MADAAETTAGTSLDSLTFAERMALQYRVEQFLYHEADLLDRRCFREWLSLVAEDVRYWMPIRRTVTLRDIDREFTRIGDMAYFDDDYRDLKMRMDKLHTGSSWSEDPPSRTRHCVTNVRVVGLDGDIVSVSSAFQLYRSRLENVEDTFFGRREDKLRRVASDFRLCQRHIYLDHTVIPSTNLSIWF